MDGSFPTFPSLQQFGKLTLCRWYFGPALCLLPGEEGRMRRVCDQGCPSSVPLCVTVWTGLGALQPRA